MANLPADRTKLALAQSNQNPSNVLGSSQNKNALTEAYDTIDLLYSNMNGLVSSAGLSKLGIINVKDYNASGSIQTTTGSITSGSNILTLATALDFANGQGINVNGKTEVDSLQITAAATVSSNVTVTLNGVAFLIAVLAGDTIAQVATKIRAATYTGWTTGGATDTIIFTSTKTGTRTAPVYSAGTTTATGTMTVTTLGSTDLITSIVSGAGTITLTLAVSATTTATGNVVVHDDTAALQSAFNWSKQNKKPVYLTDDRYYVSGTLNAGGAIIRSISGKPGRADPYTRQKADGTYVTGASDWNYFFNVAGEGQSYTWRQMITDTSYGCAIISDYDGPIIFANDGDIFDIDGIAIIGNHRKMNQDGIATAVPVAYKGANQKLNNVSVIGCGRHGINFERGLEGGVFKRVISSFNMGYGLRTGHATGITSPTEYNNFKDCGFAYNRLSGVYLTHWGKAIRFENTDFSGNGQYFTPVNPDPLLGYDRSVPATAAAMQAGIWVNDSCLDTSTGNSFGFVMDTCYGEALAKGLHMRANFTNGLAQDIRLENNVFFRDSHIPASGGQNGCAFYFDVTYAGYWLLNGNYPQALDMYRFAKVPSRDDMGNSFSLDPNFPVGSTAEQQFARLKYPAPIESNLYVKASGRTYGNQTIARDFGNFTGNIVRTDIASDFINATGNLNSNYVGIYSLTAHWQATNADQFGGYLLIVTRMPNGHYVMLTVAMSGVAGFSAAPTMDISGNLTIPSAGSVMYTLARIDNQLTNTTP